MPRFGTFCQRIRPQDWWDRTEAQARASLHAHILVWFKPREMLPTYRDIDSVPRVAPGVEPRQRPAAQEVKPLAEKTEDACYHRFHMARVTAELVRPCVAGPKWGGFDLEMMQVAFLARAIQTRLPYAHFCTTNHCLRNRNSCRPPRGKNILSRVRPRCE